MKAIDQEFAETIRDLSTEELREMLVSEHSKRIALEQREASNERINTEAHIQYIDLKEKYDALAEEYRLLKDMYRHELEKNALKTRSTYGRSTEKLLSLIDEASEKPEDFEDECQSEGSCDDSPHTGKVISFPGNSGSGKDDKGNGGSAAGRKNGNSLKKSLEKFPKETVYQINVELFNSVYGEGNWRIAFWREHISLERIPVSYYVKHTLTPVISFGIEHMISTIPFTNLLMPHSYVSPSIIADILYRKFVLGLPFYRQSTDYRISGIELSRQTIIHWVNYIVPKYLDRIQGHMLVCLIRYGYVQSDESYLLVNKDGRNAGNKSFMWVHCSSELMDCHPIIVFWYEATRGTDHLRKLFGEFLGYIICDAYISYQVIESECGGITVAGCLMHCRRYFAEALFIMNVADMSEEELAALPEIKALLLIREIYAEENKLKDLSSEDRLTERQIKVRPKVDAFFEYIHELKDSNEQFSERMRKAIQYAVNQEERLRQFLKDGNIPCDNGNSERKIRAYSIGRANWLFADTIVGAKVNATMYSIVETARANNADVRIYLQYLLEKIPPETEFGNADDPVFLDSMMPWSEAYREYEKSIKAQAIGHYRNLFPETERPKSPVKQTANKSIPIEKAV